MSGLARWPAAARLVAGAIGVALIWCGLLPRLLEIGPVARHVALMEARGVDPSAMYYTELERLPLRPAWIDERLVLWPTLPSASRPRR
jgi:HAMP domain-containing protein